MESVYPSTERSALQLLAGYLERARQFEFLAGETKDDPRFKRMPAVQGESDYQRSVRVRSCIRPLLSLGGLPLSRCSRYAAGPDVIR
jgi:hypothetical protein